MTYFARVLASLSIINFPSRSSTGCSGGTGNTGAGTGGDAA